MEYIGFQQKQNELLLLWLMKSVDLKEKEPWWIKQNQNRFVRGKIIENGILFQQTKSNTKSYSNTQEYKCRYIINMELFNSENSIKKEIQNMKKQLILLVEFMDEENLRSFYFLKQKMDRFYSNKPYCQICVEAFGMFRLQHWCDICGDIICNKCSIRKKSFLNELLRQKSIFRICKNCQIQSRICRKYFIEFNVFNSKLYKIFNHN